jgi:flagellar hook protein FlgE
MNAAGALQGGTPTALRFPTQSMTPNATSKVAAQYNFDSRNPSLNPASFNATDSSTYTYSNAYNVFDSLGNPHEMALYFIKTANDAWSVQATADGAAMTGAANLTFDVNGAIQAPTQMALTFDYANGSAPGAISVDLKGSTQFGNTSNVQSLTQDGYTSGNLNSYEIGATGIITGTYSNDQKKVIGQVVLSSFANPNGLEAVGNNAWAETGTSGQPLTGDPGPGSKLGSLTAGALEGSNVDLTTELVDLITAQRTYQANAQTLKTQDQVTQTLVNMR